MSISSNNDDGATSGWKVTGTVALTGGLKVSEFLQTKNYADITARDTAIPAPLTGMIVTVGGTFMGWNGSTWAVLG